MEVGKKYYYCAYLYKRIKPHVIELLKIEGRHTKIKFESGSIIVTTLSALSEIPAQE